MSKKTIPPKKAATPKKPAAAKKPAAKAPAAKKGSKPAPKPKAAAKKAAPAAKKPVAAHEKATVAAAAAPVAVAVAPAAPAKPAPAPKVAAEPKIVPVAKAPPPPAILPPPPAPAAPSLPATLPPRRADGTITLAHSPDADDAFMFYALAAGRVETEDRKYEHVLKDIQTLNEEAKTGTYDVTAVSFHAYPFVRRNYRLLTCGASFGDGYGPVLVAKTPIRPAEVDGMTVALPGALTTAALVTRLWFGRFKIEPLMVPFDQVVPAVLSGKARAGVIIHEGQLTYREQGLVKVVDFGQWWATDTEGLPLPLGGNGIRIDLPAPLAQKIALDLKRSIAYALGHREEALAYAMRFGRNLPKDKADKFVGMYVNDLTLDYGERGRQAVQHLYDRAHRAGLLPEAVTAEFSA